MAAERSLTAPATAASLDLVGRLLGELWADCPDGVPTGEDRVRFEMAVVEVAGNIAEHADAAAFTLHLSAGPDALVARFTDDGTRCPADPAAAELPDDPLAESGRGLALARRAVHELTYERAGTENRWRVVRRLAGA